MKKTLFFAATALAMLASCSQSDDLSAPVVAENTQPQAIEFGTYVGKNTQTRAGQAGPIIATSANPFKTAEYVLNEKGGFGVFAYHKTSASTYEYTVTTAYAPDFMYNQNVIKDTETGDGSTSGTAKDVSKWKYSPIKYWPNEFVNGDVDLNGDPHAQGADAKGNVSFFAYGPYVDFTALSTDAPANITGKNNNVTVTIPQANVKTAASYDSETGIIARTTNDFAGHPYLEYRLAKPGSTADGDNVDLLWGTAGTNGIKATGGDQNGTALIANGFPVNVNLTKMKTDGKINFNFKHALAGVGGSPALNPSGTAIDGSGLTIVYDLDEAQTLRTSDLVTTKVTVKNITITNDLDGDGDIETAGAKGDETIVRSGVFNLATGEWNLSSTDKDAGTSNAYSHQVVYGTPASGQYALNPKIAEPASIDKDTWFEHKENEGTNPGVNTTALNVYKDEVSPFLFLPGTTPKFKITVTYVTRTKDANLEKGYSEVEQTVSKIIAFTNPVQLNKKYGIKIILGLTSVKFAATVSNWSFVGDTDNDGELDSGETVTIQEIDVPKNVAP